MNAPMPAFVAVLGRHLVDAAVSTGDPALQALAGTIALAPMRQGRWRMPVAGIDASELRTLLAECFPRAGGLRTLLLGMHREGEAAIQAGDDEFDDLVALLDRHATYPGRRARWLARAVATACMASNHLWQDLGLSGRAVLNELMAKEFSTLRQLNSGDMKWKKFFYRQLCEQHDVLICKSPSCGVCSDRPACFELEAA